MGVFLHIVFAQILSLFTMERLNIPSPSIFQHISSLQVIQLFAIAHSSSQASFSFHISWLPLHQTHIFLIIILAWNTNHQDDPFHLLLDFGL